MHEKLYRYILLTLVCLLFGYFLYYLYRGQYNERNWREEVLLSNGKIITVDRKSTFYGQWEDELIVTLNIPEQLEKIPTPAPFISNELALLLDFSPDNNRWHIVTTFAKFPQQATCSIYKLYEYDGREWHEIEFDTKYYGKQTNMAGHILGDNKLITIKDLSDTHTKLSKNLKKYQDDGSLKNRPNLFFYNYFHYLNITKNCYSLE